MRLVIVSGFLGVGKTSVMLSLMDRLYDESVRFAVIENDFGKLGIDSKLVKRYGLDVTDLRGGCICCTLKSSLVETLRLLGANMNPDMVLVEPTGVADPMQITMAVTEEYVGPEIDAIREIVVLDAERFIQIKMAFRIPIMNHMRHANIVVINKSDKVDEEKLVKVEEAVREMGFEGELLRVSAETGMNMYRVAEVVAE